MSTDRVLHAVSDGVMRLTLNRAAKRNAIDSAMVEGLRAQVERADIDADVRVVAIGGAGQDFCAGADLAELLESVNAPPAQNEASARRLGEVFVRIRRLPKPVVAIVHGRALAGGCGLATACDLVLASEDASFGYPEVRRGFVPAMVMAMLRRAVGEKVAFDLVATGRLLSAEEARRLGLVSRVLPADGFEAGSDAIVRELAEQAPTTLALIKQQLYELDGLGFEDGVNLGARVNAAARLTHDFRRAVEQFLTKK